MSGVIGRIDIDEKLNINGEDVGVDIEIAEPVSVKGKIENISGYVHLEASICCSYKSSCARCLAPVNSVLTTEIDKAVCNAGVLEDEEAEDVVTNYLIIEKNELDLDEICIEEIMFALPFRVLCKEDCKGLCSKCGKNLNEGDCGCDFHEIDPRLAPLAELLK